jgi:hypothetical protein
VVMTKVAVFPTRAIPLELKVQAPVGVMLNMDPDTRLTAMVPLVAGTG